MGKGLAFEFKTKFPKMFEDYKELCSRDLLRPGVLWIWKRRILCFPTKDHWMNPSEYSYVEAGLEKFVNTYKQKGIQSIAFPLLGTGCGGLDEITVLGMMSTYLEPLDISVEIWKK